MNDQNAHKGYKSNNDGSSPVFDLLVDDVLSVRAKHALQKLDVNSVNSLMDLTQKQLLSVRHCGKKTAGEILKLAKDIKSGKYGYDPKFERRVSCDKCFPPKSRDKAYDAVVGGLGCRASSLVERLGVETVDDFIYIRLLDMPEHRGIGRVTIDEIQLVRSVVVNMLKECDQIPEDDRFYELCRRLFAQTVTSKQSWMLDPETPYKSFLEWVATIADGRKKFEKSFLMRMGLSGEPATTLEKAGQRLGITRERVRQLNNEFKFQAKWIVYQLRFKPILDRIGELVESEGGRMEIDEVFREIAESSDAYRKLSHATPFMRYIASLPVGREHGLKVDGRELVLEKA